MTAQKRIILDTDLAMGAPGSDIDDGFALAYAAASPELSIDLITTVDGNTDVHSATALTANLTKKLGLDVPLVRGASGPIMNPSRPRDIAVDLKQFPTYDPTPRAAQAIVEHVTAHPGAITLVPIGPLTNIATALLLDPSVAVNVKEIVLMGGYFFGHQNNGKVPGEFNIWADPEAAHIVLNSGAKIRLVGLDVTYQVRMNHEQARQLAQSEGGFGRFAGQCALGWIETLRTRYPHSRTHGSFHLHDPLALAAITHPDLIEWQPANVQVALDGIARGITVADTLTTHGAPAENCMIAGDVNAERFVNLFIERVAAL